MGELRHRFERISASIAASIRSACPEIEPRASFRIRPRPARCSGPCAPRTVGVARISGVAGRLRLEFARQCGSIAVNDGRRGRARRSKSVPSRVFDAPVVGLPLPKISRLIPSSSAECRGCRDPAVADRAPRRGCSRSRDRIRLIEQRGVDQGGLAADRSSRLRRSRRRSSRAWPRPS